MLFLPLCQGLQGDKFKSYNVLSHDLTRTSRMIFTVAVHMSYIISSAPHKEIQPLFHFIAVAVVASG